MLDAATRAIVTTERVAAVGGWRAQRSVAALPHAFDDLTRTLGDDVYGRMLDDPMPLASLNVLRATILAEGARLTPWVPADDSERERAHTIHDFCASVMADLSTPLDDVLYDMLAALAYGSRVAELVYAPSGAWLPLTAIKVKPREATAFVVDPFFNVRGLIGATADQRIPGALIQTAIDPANLIARDRFAVLTCRPNAGDPRGTSLLRAAYTPWWAKQQTLQELIAYLAQFASPSIWATAGEHAIDIVTYAADGITPITTPAITHLRDQLLQFRNGTALALPYGAVLNALEMTGDGTPFFTALDLYDRQIVTAMLHQTLATLEGQHQSRAASETHADILSTIVRQLRRSVARMVRNDILGPLVRYNFGDDAVRLRPAVSLGSVEQVDIPAMMAGVASLASAQLLHPSQYAGIDAQLGLPMRDLTFVPPPTPNAAPTKEPA